MLISLDIAKLYENVLKNDMLSYNISPEAVKFGIECMAHVYKIGLEAKRSEIADYSDPAHRCAYLHKYAALHTSMVRDMLYRAIHKNYNFFHKLIFSGEQFRLCSLGGGPGSDVIGSLAALHLVFSYFDSSITVVDYMEEWEYSFVSILKELRSGCYGAFGNNIGSYLNWRYIGANLLKTFDPEVIDALSSASLVTMIKFASAAACKATYSMIRNIFTSMKPGAVLFFIDNAGGGFHKLILDAAVEFGFRTLFGPLQHENYVNDVCREKRFGCFSCFKTTITVHMLQKPDIFPNVYSNSCIFENRRIILGNSLMPTGPSVLRSPPTPFLYLGKSTNENYNSLFYSSAKQEAEQDFSQDEDICEHPGFVSPVEEIPQSPNLYNAIVPSSIVTPLTSNIVNSPLSVRIKKSVIYTPDTQPRGHKRARVQGCFPINNFRRHLSRKVNNVKARARSLFKSKKKKTRTNLKC